MKKYLVVIKDIIINVFISYQYLSLLAFYIIYALLAIDYGKLPDDNILVAKSKYYPYFDYLNMIDNSKINSIGIFLFLFLILLRIFKIRWIKNSQVLLFLGYFVLLFLLMFIDPFNAFNWYLD